MNETLGPFNLILLLLPGVALKIAVRILYGRQAFAAADPLKILLTVAGNLLLLMALGGMVIGLVGLWWMLIPVLIIFLVVILMAIDRYRHGEHRALVWTLAAAAQRGVPLAEAARAFADEAQDDTGARALALARGIEQGSPLWMAVRGARLRMATPMRLAIRLGETLGMLGPAMRQQIDDLAEVDQVLRSLVTRLFYLMNVVLVGLLVLAFVVLRIVPLFQRMLQEFEVPLPAATGWVIEFSAFMVRFGWIGLVPLLLIGFLLVGLGGLYFVGFMPRDWPLVRGLFRRYDGALVMRGLALTVRRGAPLTEGLKVLAATYPVRSISRRLERAAARHVQGTDWRQSLLYEGLITRTDAAILAAAQRADNLPWALEEMADSSLRRQAYKLQALTQILFPVILVVLGSGVALFAVGMFLPLVDLILHLV